ncbi:MAG: hypothetical protein VKJ04_10265 [Vampirovibrionales bacterium]|nr:hypothetical protein [Vampirovibrionales bacterium]
MSSEREELEGPADRIDPLSTPQSKSLAKWFGLASILIFLWPLWGLLILIIGVPALVILYVLMWGLYHHFHPIT